ncbi:MAG: hypothetical protein IPG56_13340 [Caulobacteraceae bacterium]|nr:hypothetical protein [Caulobacteraceae bacterium]
MSRYYLHKQKVRAAKCGNVDEMLWVDHSSYFGPDRRRKPGGMRIRERRRYDYAGNAPPLNTALRQLRMRIIEAQGPGAAALSDRAQGVAMLAVSYGEHDAAHELSAFAAVALRGRNGDVRPALYKELDRVHALMHDAYH